MNSQSEARTAIILIRPSNRPADRQLLSNAQSCAGSSRTAFPPRRLRLLRDYPALAWEMVDSQHDVPYQAPEALVAHVRKFVGAS
jgi:hypothetical protein